MNLFPVHGAKLLLTTREDGRLPEVIFADGPLPKTLAQDWIDFLANDHARPRGADVYEDLFNHGLLFPLQRMRETAAMMRLARTIQPQVVMEIGADKGGGFYHWVKCLPTVRKAIACEIRGTPYADSFAKAFHEVKFLFLPRPSRDLETLRLVRAFLKHDLIDCLFLDGEKCFFDRDFSTYMSLMRQLGGIVMMHDILGESPPVKVFEKLKKNFRTTTIIDVSEGQEAIKRSRRGEPVFSSYEDFLRSWGMSSCGVGCVHV